MSNNIPIPLEDQRSIAQRLRAEFVHGFLSMGPVAVAADVFVAMIVGYLAWSTEFKLALMLAFAAIVLLNVFLFTTYRNYVRSDETERLAPQWYDRSVKLTLLHAACWGVLSAAAFFIADELYITFIMLIMLTLSVSAVPVLSPLFSLFTVRTVLMLGPLAILLNTVDRFEFPQVINSFSIVFPLLIIALGYLQATRARNAATLKFRTEQMVDTLNMEILERKKIEDALRDAVQRAEEADASKSRFLANVSHEIRTPLTVIHGLSDLLLMKGGHNEDVTEKVTLINQNSLHLGSIINDILDMAKIESGKLKINKQRCNPVSIIHDVCSNLKLLCEEKGVAFSYEFLPPFPVDIDTDPTRFRQILFNLLSNALKFTDQGSIRVNAHYTAESSLLQIVITDTGPGLTEQECEQIFQPFVQAENRNKTGGTGLGLSISSDLASLLGGAIHVQSEKGKGSTFTVAISTGTVNDSQIVNDPHLLINFREKQTRSSAIPELSGKVLIAEDNIALQTLIKAIMDRLSLKHEIVDNGADAVSRALSGEFDLILMDIQMPVLNGLDAMTQLRSKKCNVPIIAISAEASEQRIDQYILAGANEFLAKPVQQNELFETLSRYIGIEPASPDTTVYEEHRQLFLDSIKQNLSQMRSSLKNKQYEQLFRSAHDLKGQAKGFQLSHISQTARKLEQASRLADANAANIYINELENLFGELRLQ